MTLGGKNVMPSVPTLITVAWLLWLTATRATPNNIAWTGKAVTTPSRYIASLERHNPDPTSPLIWYAVFNEFDLMMGPNREANRARWREFLEIDPTPRRTQ